MKRKVLLQCLSLVIAISLIPTIALAEDSSFSLTVNNERPVTGQDIQVTVTADNLDDMYGYEINLTYDPSQLRYVRAENDLEGFPVSMDPKDGKLVFAHTKVGQVDGESGKLDLATITFEANGTNNKPTAITLTHVTLVKSDLTTVEHEVNVNLEITALSFNDLNDHWAKQAIERAAGLGIVNGYTDGTFRPQENVTRAEFTVMMGRALEFKSTSDAVLSDFADLGRIPDWAKPFISEARKAGIITGYEDNTFRPNHSINRSEMAVMAIRALEKEIDQGLKPTFADADSIAAWAQPSVAAAAEAGLINGRSNNRFVPAANATRAEAAVMILRLVNY